MTDDRYADDRPVPVDDDPALPDQTTDDTDAGWGERTVDDEADAHRLIEDRPPHWDTP